MRLLELIAIWGILGAIASLLRLLLKDNPIVVKDILYLVLGTLGGLFTWVYLFVEWGDKLLTPRK